MEAALHRELFNSETEMKKQSTRIIKEAEKIDNYEEYHKNFTNFLDEYNELGVSALAQYIQHRKIILEFLERAINVREGEKNFPDRKSVGSGKRGAVRVVLDGGRILYKTNNSER